MRKWSDIALIILTVIIIAALAWPRASFAQLVERHIGYAFENLGFLSIPGALAYDKDRHRLAIADRGRRLVYLFDLNDRSSQTLGSNQEMKEPVGLAFDSEGALFVTQTDSPTLLKFLLTSDQPETLDIGAVTSHPGRIFISGDKKYIADKDNNAIYVINSADSLLIKMTKKLRQPDGILVNSSGEIIVADRGIDPILIFDSDGEFERRLSRPESPTSQISFAASGLATDQRGWIYTLDITHFKIISFDPAGVNRQEWAPPEPPFFPEDIAIDKYDLIYVSERGSGRVQIFMRAN